MGAEKRGTVGGHLERKLGSRKIPPQRGLCKLKTPHPKKHVQRVSMLSWPVAPVQEQGLGTGVFLPGAQ